MGSAPDQLDARVARLETHMEHMSSNINRILAELHDLRTSTEARFEVVNQKFEGVNEKFDAVNERISALHVSMVEKFGEIKVWALTVLGGGVGFGILTVIARAFHWI